MVPTNELESYPRRSKRRWLIAALGVAVVGVLLALTLRPADQENRAPDFALPLLSGERTLNSEDLAGHPVVLNFWASWCDPCREEIPVIESVWNEYKDRGVVVVGINVQDTEGAARAFEKEFGMTYPLVTDYEGDVSKKLGVVGLPVTVFIDRDWTLLGSESGADTDQKERGTVVLGAISRNQLVSNIERMLEAED